MGFLADLLLPLADEEAPEALRPPAAVLVPAFKHDDRPPLPPLILDPALEDELAEEADALRRWRTSLEVHAHFNRNQTGLLALASTPPGC